jgi:hypothetical protein
VICLVKRYNWDRTPLLEPLLISRTGRLLLRILAVLFLLPHRGCFLWCCRVLCLASILTSFCGSKLPLVRGFRGVLEVSGGGSGRSVERPKCLPTTEQASPIPGGRHEGRPYYGRGCQDLPRLEAIYQAVSTSSFCSWSELHIVCTLCLCIWPRGSNRRGLQRPFQIYPGMSLEYKKLATCSDQPRPSLPPSFSP